MSSPRVPLFYVDDPRFDAHLPPREHPERPERLTAVRKGLVAALVDHGASALPARAASEAELLRAHSAAHIATLEQLFASAPTTFDDGDTYVSPLSRDAAYLCAGSAAMLGELAMQHSVVRTVLTGRPPGHHATRDEAMGFCLFNNVAMSAYAALEAGARKVAIVDFDVHHGNGTQDIFERDPRVLFISLHESPLYPDTGYVHEVGLDEGRGSTLNIPLPPGSTGVEYAAAFRELVLPALARFAADLTLVSAGFDAHARDPLASMHLDASDYGAMATALIAAARRGDTQRVGVVLEGGYDLLALEQASQAVGRALCGVDYAFPEGAPSEAAQKVIAEVKAAHAGLGLLG